MIRTLQPIKTVSKRTMKLLEDHGRRYEIVEFGAHCCLENPYQIKVRSLKDDWTGWIAEGEVMLIK